VDVVGNDQHAGSDIAFFHWKNMAVAASADVIKVFNAVLAHDLANLSLALRGQGTGGNRLVICGDQKFMRRMQTVYAQFLHDLVKVHHVPVVGCDQIRLRVDDVTLLDRSAACT
jgi:hypothetical protein